MQKTEKVLVCDVCGKKTTDEGEGWYGGHPFQGWYHVQEHGGSTQLSELQRKKDWDICSKECLKKLADGHEEKAKLFDKMLGVCKPLLDEFELLKPKT